MSFGGLRARQILALALVAAAIVGISLAWEISEVGRASIEESRRDAQYIAHSLVRQIQFVVAEDPTVSPYDAVRADPNLRVTLSSATRFAPTVLYAAFCDSLGDAVVHSDLSREGAWVRPADSFPENTGLADTWRFLLALRQGSSYEYVTPLRMGSRSFGTVRIGLGSLFIRDEVRRVMRRGVVVGLSQVALALIAVFFLTRIVVGPLREVRRGLEALRRGDFSYRIPRIGIDEFASMADTINELGDHFGAREREGESDGPLRRAVEHLADGLVMLGPDREITHINGIAATRLGVDGNEVLGKNLTRVFPEDHPLCRLTDEVMSSGQDRTSLRVELPGTNGSSPVMVVGHRIDESGDAFRLLVELKDLTVLEELQAVMDHSTTLSRLGEMAAGVAHEIRNPLHAITLSLEPLRGADNLDSKEVQEALALTREQIARLDRAVTGFLRVARLQRLAMVQLSPVSLAREVVDLLTPEATMAGLDLNLETDENVPKISGDTEVLRQALLNLVKNSIQALPSREGSVRVSCRYAEGKVGISVEDSGPGIDAQVLPKVFDLYVTTKAGGTGVGLAFVRQAVEMHRGTVTVDSDVNRGTTVTMWLRAEVHAETSYA